MLSLLLSSSLPSQPSTLPPNPLAAAVVTKPPPIVSVQAFNAQLAIGGKDKALRSAADLFKTAAEKMEAGRVAGETVPIYWLRTHGWWPCWQCRESHFSRSVLYPQFKNVTQTILVLKYVVPKYGDPFTYYGYANVAQNIAIMLSAVILWMAQSVPSDYEYSLSI